MDQYQNPATEKQHGLPSTMFSKLILARMGRLSNGVDAGIQSLYGEHHSLPYRWCRSLHCNTWQVHSTLLLSTQGAKIAVQRAAVFAPHPNQAGCFIKATCEVSFTSSDSRYWWYVSHLSSFTPRCVGIWMDRQFLSSVTLSLWPVPCCSDGRWPTPFWIDWTSAAKSEDILLVSWGLG